MMLARRAYAAAAIAWAAALPVAAFVGSRAHVSAAASAAAIAIYAVGSVVCHQLPARSFHLWSAQLPVCARCTGIYLGAAFAVVVFVRRRGEPACSPLVDKSIGADTWVGPYRARMIVLVSTLPTLGTLLYEWTTGDTPSNVVRFVAGLPLGAVVSWLVSPPSPRLRRTSRVN